MFKDPIIIALSGKKGGGKNTLASFIAGYYRDQVGLTCQNAPCQELAFADGLKDFCIDTLGLNHNQCYGSDDDKNTSTQYKWKNTPKWRHMAGSHRPGSLKSLIEVPELMTGREVMQVFGTECVRAWFGNVWAEATIRKIRKLSLGLAIITDSRFLNEVETILGQPKGYIIRLTRSPFTGGGDLHSSETDLDYFDWDRPNCFVLDNAQMTKNEQNEAVIPVLQKIF